MGKLCIELGEQNTAWKTALFEVAAKLLTEVLLKDDRNPEVYLFFLYVFLFAFGLFVFGTHSVVCCGSYICCVRCVTSRSKTRPWPSKNWTAHNRCVIIIYLFFSYFYNIINCVVVRGSKLAVE